MRIKHLSVSVKSPELCAKILAEMTDGRVETFTTRTMEGAFVCMWGTDSDELLEFLPEGYLMVSTDSGAQFQKIDAPLGYNSTHVQLEVAVPLDQIKAVADKYHCHHYFRPRSGGPLYEVWIEDEFLVEFVSDEIRQL